MTLTTNEIAREFSRRRKEATTTRREPVIITEEHTAISAPVGAHLDEWTEWEVDRHRIGVTVMLITPEMCAEWLDGHDNYRFKRDRRVARYATEMKAGRWELTGDPIRFVDGTLVDGQHRLHGCIESGSPFLSLVVSVGEEAVSVIDRGMPRNSSDELRRTGLTEYASVLPAVAAMVMTWREGRLANMAMWRNMTPPSVVEEFCMENAAMLSESTRLADRARKEVGCTRSHAAAFFFEALMANEVEARRFAEMFISGANLEDDDPIYTLRKWATSKSIGNVKVAPEEFLGSAAQAWNAWMDGKSMRRITYRATGKGRNRQTPAKLVGS